MAGNITPPPQMGDDISVTTDDTCILPTPQIVDNTAEMADNTSWLIVACQVKEVGGKMKFVG